VVDAFMDIDHLRDVYVCLGADGKPNKVIKLDFVNSAYAQVFDSEFALEREYLDMDYVDAPPERDMCHLIATGFPYGVLSKEAIAAKLNEVAGDTIVKQVSLMARPNTKNCGQAFITFRDPTHPSVRRIKLSKPYIGDSPLVFIKGGGIQHTGKNSAAREKQPSFTFRLSNVHPAMLTKDWHGALTLALLPTINTLNKAKGNVNPVKACDISIAATRAKDMGENCWRVETNNQLLIEIVMSAYKKKATLLIRGLRCKLHLDHADYNRLNYLYLGQPNGTNIDPSDLADLADIAKELSQPEQSDTGSEQQARENEALLRRLESINQAQQKEQSQAEYQGQYRSQQNQDENGLDWTTVPVQNGTDKQARATRDRPSTTQTTGKKVTTNTHTINKKRKACGETINPHLRSPKTHKKIKHTIIPNQPTRHKAKPKSRRTRHTSFPKHWLSQTTCLSLITHCQATTTHQHSHLEIFPYEVFLYEVFSQCFSTL